MKDKNYNWISIGANVGVVIGIALLIYELNQNREMMKVQIRNEISNAATELLLSDWGNLESSTIWVKAMNGEELDPAEYNMLESRLLAMFRYWENVNYQYRQGMYDENEYAAQKVAISEQILAAQHSVDFWCLNKQWFSEAFRIELDASLGSEVCL